jgi:uridine kinase
VSVINPSSISTVPDGPIRPSIPRTTVAATFPDGRVFEAPVGARVGDLVRAAYASSLQPAVAVSPTGVPLVAAHVDGKLREFETALLHDATVVPVAVDDSDGARIYRRSLSFLLVTAAAELFPGVDLFIEHAAPAVGGYFCEVRGREPFSQQELWRIEARMREIVDEDAPLVKSEVPVGEAMDLFRARGELDKARLLAHRAKATLHLYELRGRRDYFQGYMVQSAGCLRQFALHAYPPGFMLQFPHQSRPQQLAPLTPYPKLFEVFEEAGHWLDRLGIRNAGALNDAIAAGRLPEVSLVGEALHEARVATIAQDIARQRERIRVVLVAGPSSSGKTTFSKRLAVQLLANGLRPFALAMDDYFVDRDLTPRDASGDYDFECLEALDIALFNEHLLSLMACQPTTLPHYLFAQGRRERGPTISLAADSVIIVEGIHGLNPALVPQLPADSIYRVYVSALTQLNLDRHNRVSTTDCRLVRRIVRDAATRGYDAWQSIRRWESVTRGEKQFIFPFQENGDAVFNSSLVHELAILRPLAEPLLLQVRHDTPEYREANRLLSFLQWFRPASPEPVPDNSILREFVGGSMLENFRLWRGGEG